MIAINDMICHYFTAGFNSKYKDETEAFLQQRFSVSFSPVTLSLVYDGWIFFNNPKYCNLTSIQLGG